MKIADLLDEYRRYSLNELGMKPKSHLHIQRLVVHFDRFLGCPDLAQIDKLQIRSYLHEQLELRGWKPKTFVNKRQYLKSFFNFCVEYEYIDKNPVDGVKKPKVPKPAPRYLTKEQLHQILNAIRWHDWKYSFEGERNETIIAFATMTGLRNAEIRNLRVGDIKLSEGWIFVRCGKGDKFRYVPIHPKLRKVIEKWLRCRNAHGIESEYFFVGLVHKHRMSEFMMQNLFHKASQISGIAISCHMLRHSYGFLCSNSGVNPRAIQKVMGHSCIRTTMRYSDISPMAVKEQISAASLI